VVIAPYLGGDEPYWEYGGVVNLIIQKDG